MDHEQLRSELQAQLMDSRKLGIFWNPSALPKKLINYYYHCDFDELVHVLRIYDVTKILLNGKNAHRLYEIAIPYHQGYWYVKALMDNHCYLAELGCKLDENEFFPLFRSNMVQIPAQAGAMHGWSGMNVLPQNPQTACFPKWRDHVSTYSYYEGRTHHD